IFYCSRCLTRLFGNQFVEGTAYRVREKVACENCLGEIIAPLSVEEQQEILLQAKALKDSQMIEEIPQGEPINQEEFFELDTPDGEPGDEYFELDTPEKRAARMRKPKPVSVTSKSAAAEAGPNRAAMIFLICLVGSAALGSFLYFNSTSDNYSRAPERPSPPPYNPSVRTYTGSSATDPRAEESKALIQKAKDFAQA